MMKKKHAKRRKIYSFKVPYSLLALIILLCVIFLESLSVIDVEEFLNSNTLERVVDERTSELQKGKTQEINLSAAQISFNFCGDENFPCFETFTQTLNSSNSSIKCAIQDLNDKTLSQILVGKTRDGVEVEIIIDESYNDREIVQELKKKNVTIFDDSSRNSGKYTNLMHEKFCVVDSKTVIVGSANPTSFGLRRNENIVMRVDNSTILAQEFTAEFNQLRNGKFGQEKTQGNFTNYEYQINNKSSSQVLGDFEVAFCPQEGCDTMVVDVLNSSQESIYFATFVLTLDDIEEVLISKSKQDVEVKGIVESRLINARGSIISNMSQRFFQIRRENASPTMHHKLFIVDEEIVIFGSLNPSASGAYYNDESVILLNSSYYAKKFTKEFENLYEEGVSIE